MMPFKDAEAIYNAQLDEEYKKADALITEAQGRYVGEPITVEVPGTSTPTLIKIGSDGTAEGWSVTWATGTQTSPPTVTFSKPSTATASDPNADKPKRKRGPRKPKATT
jgi:hypothetical protein